MSQKTEKNDENPKKTKENLQIQGFLINFAVQFD